MAESKRQYEESKRLAAMPFLYLEHIKSGNVRKEYSTRFYVPLVNASCKYVNCSSAFLLRNVGNGTATNIIYTWEIKETNVYETEPFPLNAVPIKSEQIITCSYLDNGEKDYEYPDKATLQLQYDDLLGNTYEQNIFFEFEKADDSDILLRCEVDIPRFLGVVKYKLKEEREKENA